MTVRALPYGYHTIDESDVAAVQAALERQGRSGGLIDRDDMDAVLTTLRGPLLAQGPEVARFEDRFAQAVGAKFASACSSGTAALHLALSALDVRPGDICVAPAITFLSTATAVRFCGAEVLFCDVDSQSGLMTPETLRDAISRAPGPVRAVLPVHLGGRMCDVAGISDVAEANGAVVVEDACHALGTSHPDLGRVGQSLRSTATVFSFHPVKTIACGEGGMVTSNDPELNERIRRLRNHGVTRDPERMEDRALSFGEDGAPNPWSYEQLELGFNYRLNELEAALGNSQLSKLDRFVAKRRELVLLYQELLKPISRYVRFEARVGDEDVSFHIAAVQIVLPALRQRKAELMRRLVEKGVGCQVHYIPVYRQPYFRRLVGEMRLPGSEIYYEATLTLPLFPAMTEEDVSRVVLVLTATISEMQL